MPIHQVPYTKFATTYDEQIMLLRSRGLIISDENKAREILSDIGYYRLGFYIHPFELTYPNIGSGRSHEVEAATRIEDVVALYYFDLDLRNILNRYLSRIEVALRTTITYELSVKYKSNPTWFVDGNVVSSHFISEFQNSVYSFIKTKPVIKRHHQKYLGQYAPAWKTMEYMTLGNIEILFDSLKNDADKLLICNHFGEPIPKVFKSYLTTIREVRNACAHGNVVFCMTLSFGILRGMACDSFPAHTQQTFHGALRVVDYMLKRISVNRESDMWNEIFEATRLLYSKSPKLQPLIESSTGIILPDIKTSKTVNFEKK